MLMAIGTHDPLRSSPLLDRPVFGEGSELPLPKFPIHERSGIGSDQTLASPLGGSAHADLVGDFDGLIVIEFGFAMDEGDMHRIGF